jgi:hypothetical protein
VRASQGIAEEDSPFAYEGTVMHEYRAEALKESLDPASFIGDIRRVNGGKMLRITEDLALALVDGIERIYDLTGGPQFPGASYAVVEEKLFFQSRELQDCYGTVDFGAVVDEEVISDDLKFGAGVPVFPQHNPQQMIYALLMLDNLEADLYRRVKRVRIIIDQPRIERAGGEWVTTITKLLRWRDETLLPGVAETQRRKAPYNPGPEQCFWCKARKVCDARAEFVGEALGLVFEDETDARSLRTAQPLSAARKSYLLDLRGMIETFLKDVHATVMDDAAKGRETPGRKVIEVASGHRKWLDPKEAEEALTKLLGPKALKSEVVSPATAEKLLPRSKHKEISALVKMPPKTPKLVSIDDDREPLEARVQFTDER